MDNSSWPSHIAIDVSLPQPLKHEIKPPIYLPENLTGLSSSTPFIFRSQYQRWVRQLKRINIDTANMNEPTQAVPATKSMKHTYRWINKPGLPLPLHLQPRFMHWMGTSTYWWWMKGWWVYCIPTGTVHRRIRQSGECASARLLVTVALGLRRKLARWADRSWFGCWQCQGSTVKTEKNNIICARR